MQRLLTQVRFALKATVVFTFVLLACPASAQEQPNVVNPSASAVQEQQLLQQFKRIQGRGTIPDVKSYVIEQPAGRQWQTFHEVYLHWIGGIAIIGIFVLLVTFYLWRGTLHFGARSGRKVLRFTVFERFVHWMTAVCFIALAVSGLNITFGKKLLLPVIGANAFTAWSQAAKYLHDYVSFPFTVGILLMFVMWVGSNFPTRVDIEWMKQGGGMFGGKEPPAFKFNAGEKLIFWISTVGGGIAAVTGYILILPFYGTGIAGMQLADVVHSVVGVLYIAALLVHTYMGTLGTEGAFEGMVSGDVDVNWAKVRHPLWYEEEVARTGMTLSQAYPQARDAEV